MPRMRRWARRTCERAAAAAGRERPGRDEALPSALAIDGLDVDIGHGITGLLGPNGAGKTTFISLVLGLRTRDEGELTVLGHDPATVGHRRARPSASRRSTTICRPTCTLPTSSVTSGSSTVYRPRRDPARERRALAGRARRGAVPPLRPMSTGQRQRVKLAGAIVHDPARLLDEPTDGLDPLQRDDMLALIRRVGTEFGMDIVISSHQLEEAEQICDAVVILGDGAVVRAGTSASSAATPSASGRRRRP